MSYSVKEIFYTLQGEGGNAGRAAVFCRFAGCNLWSGREVDRALAQCKFCDTDFVGTDGTGGGKFATAQALATAIAGFWPVAAPGKRLVVLTGGEPLLQVDTAVIAALHELDFEIAVETNGTVAAPEGIDWLCVSPKANTELKVRAGRELKVVVPQMGQDLEALIALPFDRHLLQPMDGPLLKENTQWAIEYCMRDPRWRLSVQTHKMVGIR
ncbi:7-carboxy-7-deazaguanine synthase [Ottowia thiooxydans]|uniref:7-carboxy-7-deazaguanine synthase n=1 Tax=Ottowia thiooxydans TaxID=219182 RepID=A0ABV2Q7C8_9BURK